MSEFYEVNGRDESTTFQAHTACPPPAEGELPDVSQRLTFEGCITPGEDVMPINDLGGGLSLISTTAVEFTHTRASELLQLPEFVVNDRTVDRTLNDNHVSYLVNTMKRGTFHPEWVSIITCVCKEKMGGVPAGTEFRMNGQHTAWARLYMPEEFPCKVKYLRYEAKTMGDMRILYSSIDRSMARTRGVIVNSYLAGTEAFKDVPSRTLKKMAASLPIWLWEDNSKRRAYDADAIAYLMITDYAEVCYKVSQYLISGPRNRAYESRIERTPILAAVFETFNKLPSRAHEFWDVVRDGLGVDVQGLNDPRIRLHNALRDSVLAQGAHMGHSGGKGGKKTVPVEVMYRWCINCWNNWRKGELIANLRSSFTGTRPKAK